jgi:hypothetical protein
MPNMPYTQIDIQEVMTRNAAARRIVAGFSAATPTLADVWQYVQSALADAGRLAAEVARLSAELSATRLDRANLLAAMRATLAAQRDGEADPLSYLRDELEAPQRPSQTRGRQP